MTKNYISKTESEKCRQIMRVFSNLYDKTDTLVLDAGKYGFLLLKYYNEDNQFETCDCFIDSQALFRELLEIWRERFLLDFAQKIGMENKSYRTIEKNLPDDIRNEFEAKYEQLKNCCLQEYVNNGN